MNKSYIENIEEKLFETVRNFFDDVGEKVAPFFKKISKKMGIKNLPDILTFSRFLGLPLSAIYYIGALIKNPWMIFLPIVPEVLLGITDLLDGYLAREPEFQESDFGKLIDPFADKFFTGSATIFITLAMSILVSFLFQIILWTITGIYLALELSLIFLARKADKIDKRLLGATEYGKMKFTSAGITFFIVSILVGLAVLKIIPIEIPYSMFALGMIITKYFAIKSIKSHINEYKNLMA